MLFVVSWLAMSLFGLVLFGSFASLHPLWAGVLLLDCGLVFLLIALLTLKDMIFAFFLKSDFLLWRRALNLIYFVLPF